MQASLKGGGISKWSKYNPPNLVSESHREKKSFESNSGSNFAMPLQLPVWYRTINNIWKVIRS